MIFLLLLYSLQNLSEVEHHALYKRLFLPFEPLKGYLIEIFFLFRETGLVCP